MATQITWLGHNAWSIETAGKTVLLDPFLDDSPTAPVKADEVQADFILLSHGHGDHFGDTFKIAKRTGAAILAGFEVGEWLKGQGVAEDKVTGLNPGGLGMTQPGGLAPMPMAPGGNTAVGENPTTTELTFPEHILVRFLDVTVRPKEAYEYTIQMRLANPNFPTRFKKDVAYQSLTKDPELLSKPVLVAEARPSADGKTTVQVPLRVSAPPVLRGYSGAPHRKKLNCPTSCTRARSHS